VKYPVLNRAHLVATAAITIAVASIAGLSWAFSEQLALSRKLQMEEARLQRAVAAEQARYETLLELEEYVQSDKFVEDWARGGPRMKKAGERIVVSPSRVPEPEPMVAEPVGGTVAPDGAVWHQVLELLFGPSNSP
jgi:hypothetical protein